VNISVFLGRFAVAAAAAAAADRKAL